MTAESDDDVVEIADLPRLGGLSIPTEVLVAVGNYTDDRREVFAGLLIAGGSLWIGFTDDADEHLAGLRALSAAAGWPIRAFRADYSLHDLQTLQEAVARDFEALQDEDVHVTTVGVDVYVNRLRIGIRNSFTAAATEVLGRRYPLDLITIDAGVDVQAVSHSSADGLANRYVEGG